MATGNVQDFALEVLANLNGLRQQRVLCDVTVIVGDTHNWAHKNVLAIQSPYFRSLFSGSNSQQQPMNVFLDELDAVAVEKIISFCYTGFIEIDCDNVLQIMPAACHLEMEKVKNECCSLLKKHLEPGNCLGMKAFAETHDCADFVKLTDEFCKINIEKVLQSDEFMLLSKRDIISLISDDELGLQSEEQVYHAVMNWVRFDIENRKNSLPELFRCVRFNQMPRKFLVSVGSDELVKNDAACREIIDEAKNYFLLPRAERSLVLGPRSGSRRPSKKESVKSEAHEGSVYSEEDSC